MAEGKKNASRLKAWLLFLDESGLLRAPLVRRSWSRRGRTPLLYQRTRTHHKVSIIAALCVAPTRDRVRLYFRLHANRSITSTDIREFLRILSQHLHGPKFLVWDRLGAHRSKATQAFLRGRPDYRTIVLPSYAPELNPVEYLWAWLKRHALANFCPDTLAELQHTARGRLKSAQRRSAIIAACWTQAELF